MVTAKHSWWHRSVFSSPQEIEAGEFQVQGLSELQYKFKASQGKPTRPCFKVKSENKARDVAQWYMGFWCGQGSDFSPQYLPPPQKNTQRNKPKLKAASPSLFYQ